MALNFFIADIGHILPHVISGAEVVAIVLSLPTTGPLLISRAAEPGHVPGRLVPDVARRVLTVIGMLISDSCSRCSIRASGWRGRR